MNNIGVEGAKVLGEALKHNNVLTTLYLTGMEQFNCNADGLILICLRTDNEIGAEEAKELLVIANNVGQQRVAKKKQYQQAISLILLSYQFSEESAFHVLPLEMVHLIIRFVLNDMPAATTLDIGIV